MENKSEKSIKLVKRLVREHVRPYFGKLLLAAICMAIVAAATATNAWLMQPVLDEVFLNKKSASEKSFSPKDEIKYWCNRCCILWRIYLHGIFR